MSFVPNDEIDLIRSKANIVDIIGDYLALTKKGKNFACVCPFHDDHAPSMSISVEKQIYKCFSCNAAGNVFTFIQNYENISFIEAVKKVADKVGISLSMPMPEKVDKFKYEHAVMDLAAKFFQNNLKTELGYEARQYLKKRGLEEDLINQFEIGLALDNSSDLYKVLQKKNYNIETINELGLINIAANQTYDVFTRRIMFPLWDLNGQVVAFSGRIYRDDGSAKYINSKETKIFKKGENLYNYHNVKEQVKKFGYIIVVEGYMDAIRLASQGINSVVALMGTSMTKEQVELLKKLKTNVILCLDSDPAGIKAMITNGEMLIKEKINVNVIKLSGAKDPDEYILKNGIEAFMTNLKNPLNYFEFKLAEFKANKDLTKAEDLANYINEVIANLNALDDDILKEVTLNKISKEYDISLDILKSKLINKKAIEVSVPVNKLIVKKTSYQLAAEKILYFMMNGESYVKMYSNRLGYLDDIKYREVASEIIWYYEKDKNADHNLADFISHVATNQNISQLVTDIVGSCSEDEVTMEAMEQYIIAADKAMIEKEIKKLKILMKEELDINKKLEIITKIAELKRGSVNNVKN